MIFQILLSFEVLAFKEETIIMRLTAVVLTDCLDIGEVKEDHSMAYR